MSDGLRPDPDTLNWDAILSVFTIHCGITKDMFRVKVYPQGYYAEIDGIGASFVWTGYDPQWELSMAVRSALMWWALAERDGVTLEEDGYKLPPNTRFVSYGRRDLRWMVPLGIARR